MIYLDNASTTKIDPLVLEAMMPYLTEEFGNAGTIYGLGRKAKVAISEARSQVAEFIGAAPDNIIFTSGGTEANNMVFDSLLDYFKQTGKNHVITDKSEHISVLESARRMCIKLQFGLTEMPVNHDGRVEIEDVISEIRDKTGLVSVMYMNNETGVENPVYDIGMLCRKTGSLFHSDCVQAAGCCKLNVDTMNCDFMSLSSHKIHGPKGVGALYVRDRSLLSPMIYGGSAQEFGLRGGTENVVGIVGFGAACKIMNDSIYEVSVHNSAMKHIFYLTLSDELTSCGLSSILHVNGDTIGRYGKTTNIRFDNVDGETLLLMLDAKGVCISAGSACHSHESKPSHVLTAMGVRDEDALSSIRVSFSKMNTEAEVRDAATVMAQCVRALHG